MVDYCTNVLDIMGNKLEDIDLVQRKIINNKTQQIDFNILTPVPVNTTHDQAIGNWGTSQNASDTEINRDNNIIGDNNPELSVQFNTAWCAPKPWFSKLVETIHKEAPGISLKLEYADEGEAFGGRLTGTAGVVDVVVFNDPQIQEFLYGDAVYHPNKYLTLFGVWEQATLSYDDEIDDEDI